MSRSTEQELTNDEVVPETVTKEIRCKAAQSRAESWKQIFLFAALGFAGMFGYAWWRTQDLGSAWPYMNGQRVFAVPHFVFVGEIEKNSDVAADVRFRNLDSSDHTIVGARKSCSCISTDEFPIIVPARGEAVVKVQFRAKKVESAFEHKIGFFMDAHQYTVVPVQIAGIAR